MPTTVATISIGNATWEEALCLVGMERHDADRVAIQADLLYAARLEGLSPPFSAAFTSSAKCWAVYGFCKKLATPAD